MQANRRPGPPKWLKPCGEHEDEDDSEVGEAYFDQAALQAKILLDYWKSWGEKWVKETFGKSEDDHHSTFPHKYDAWGPKIPKEYKQPTPESEYQNLEADDVIGRSHEALQRCAVGLEQVVDDMIVKKDKYANEFKGLELKLNALLCEISLLTKKREISRKVMPDEIRDIKDEGERHLRDWIITRDTLNTFEYVRDMMNFIHENGIEL